MEDSRIDELIEQVRTLSLQVEELKQELRRRDSRSPPSRTLVAKDRSGFEIGDRVRVLNAVKKPATWDNSTKWIEAEARLGTVTKVRVGQIFYTTDNGTETWRAPNNLRRLTQHE
jgi:hypothetical protein